MKWFKAILTAMCLLLVLAGCKSTCVHDYQSQITREATCTAEGEETFTCALCQDSYTVAVSLLEHILDEGTVTKEPTCDAEGCKTKKCTSCDFEVVHTIEKLPHTFEEATVTKEPNCTEEGISSVKCTVCGATEEESIPVNDEHAFVTEVVKKATCETEGTKKLTCSSCGYWEEKSIPALDHKWKGATCTSAGVCATCGATGKKGSHAYTVTYETKASKYFAGQQDKECSTCGKKSTLYYTKKHELDLAAIRRKVANYAESLGFKVTLQNPSRDTMFAYSQQVWQLDRLGDGPDNLVKGGKWAVDNTYAHFTRFSNSVSNITLYISVHYYSSASMGYGAFSVAIVPVS